MRQQATQRLLVSREVSMDQLRQWFAQADSPEQRHRLLNVIRHHLARAMRQRRFPTEGPAALGFAHEMVSADVTDDVATALAGAERGVAVRVVATLPGFPAHAWLRRGDLIVGIDGESFPDQLTGEAFRNHLQARRAGERLVLDVLRDGRPMRISLELASAQALAAMYRNAPILVPPFRELWLAEKAALLKLAPPVPVLTPMQSSAP